MWPIEAFVDAEYTATFNLADLGLPVDARSQLLDPSAVYDVLGYLGY
jgi:hypothetical protein